MSDKNYPIASGQESMSPSEKMVDMNVGQVLNGRVLLGTYQPDRVYRVSISGYVEIDFSTEITSSTQFKVDYNNGTVYFDSSQEGVNITVSEFWAKGRIYLDSNSVIMEDGSTLDELEDKVDEHIAGTDNRHDSDAIDNASTTLGTTQSDVNENLKAEIDTLVLGASNATIGAYPISTTGVDTYAGVFTDLTYFIGLFINLMDITDNTGTSTFNLNGLGAKDIKIATKDGMLRDVYAGELHDAVIIIYDGTQFIVAQSDAKEAQRKIDDSFYADIDAYYGNVKAVADFQDASLWTAGVENTLDTKLGGKNLRITDSETVTTLNNIDTLNLDLFNNGATIIDSEDFLNIIVNISDVAMFAISTYAISIQFGADSIFSSSNRYILNIANTALKTGYNYLKLKKSSVTKVGTISWDEIKSLKISMFYATSVGNTVDFQLIQLVKKDPLEDYPNPFQKFGVRDFAINSGEWFVGEEFGEIVMKEFGEGTFQVDALQTNIAYKDFTVTRIVNADISRDTGHLTWYIDSTNWITFQINNDIIRLEMFQSGISDVSYDVDFPVVDGDIVYLKLVKSGTNISAYVYKNNDETTSESIKVSTTLDGLTGYLAMGIRSGGLSSYVYSASITQIAHAHHSSQSDVSSSLLSQQASFSSNSSTQGIATGTADISISLDADTQSEMFESSSPTKRTIREPGRYLIILDCEYEANVSGIRDSKIKINGTQCAHENKLSVSSGTTGINLSTVEELSPNDVITYTTWQNSGTALNATCKLRIVRQF